MALDRIKFNIASFNDADAGGNNYYAGIIYEVFNSNDTLADIYSDAAGANQINQDGISNKSNASGEVVFYIDSGDYYIKVNENVEYFSTLLSSGALINDMSQSYNFDGVDSMINSTIDFDEDKPLNALSNSYIKKTGFSPEPASYPDLSAGGYAMLIDGYVNIESYGAIAGTDSTAAIDAAIDTGMPVYIPARKEGVFIYSGTEKLITTSMFGDGSLSRIQCTANNKIFGVGVRAKVSGIRFIGNGKNSGDTNQEILYVEQGGVTDNSRGQFLVTMNLAQDVGGTFFSSRTLVNNHEGGIVSMNQCLSVNVGFDFDERGEYTTAFGNNVTKSTLACIIKGGNTNAYGNNFSSNDKGVLIDSGTNDGHGNLNSNLINHNTINLHAKGILKETFSVLGNQFFVGDIWLENTVGLKVAHCDISTGDILEQGATKCYFESCNYHDSVSVVPNLISPSEVFHFNPTGRDLTPNSVSTTNAARLVGTLNSTQTVSDGAVDDVVFGSIGQSLPFNAAYTVQSFYNSGTGEINGDAYVRDYGLHVSARVVVSVGRVSTWDNQNVDLEIYDSSTGDTVLVATKSQVIDSAGTFISKFIIDGGLRKNAKYKIRLRNNSGASLFVYNNSIQTAKIECWGF